MKQIIFILAVVFVGALFGSCDKECPGCALPPDPDPNPYRRFDAINSMTDSLCVEVHCTISDALHCNFGWCISTGYVLDLGKEKIHPSLGTMELDLARFLGDSIRIVFPDDSTYILYTLEKEALGQNGEHSIYNEDSWVLERCHAPFLEQYRYTITDADRAMAQEM